MEKLALIYIGGNTTRYALWKIEDDKSYRLLESYKENLKLGKNTKEEFSISEENVTSLVKIMTYFKDFSDSAGAENPHVILSEFFEHITNKDEIRKKLETELKLNVIELTNRQEIHLDYLAVKNSMNLNNSLLVDISGASTQLGWMKDGTLIDSYRLPIGTLSLTEKFHLEDHVTKEDHTALDKYLKEELDAVDWLSNGNFHEMIILGGSSRAISKIDRKKRRYPINIIHEYTMQDLDILSMYRSLITKNLKQRYTIEGIDRERADILPAALAILNALIGKTRIINIRVSGTGIREGFLFDYIDKNYGTLPDMLDRSILNILRIHNVDVDKAKSLYVLTKSIYDGFSGIRKEWKNAENIIKVSSMLRDVGLSVRYYNHHKHNFYIISNSEINGMDHREIIQSAMAATFTDGIHRDAPLLQFGQIINRLDIDMISDIGICISIAEKLLSANKMDIQVKNVSVLDEKILLEVYSAHTLDFEIHEIRKLNKTLTGMYGKELEVIHLKEHE
ncbi:hypothetical protein ACHAL6_08165 [Proteiniclasticum sp. C24MP]|uniref:Ppx/GppA phosphatase family protein n=1 Tax=Proteiniclasticum sp. C24MP TaxID=3374101 RepID=UPI003754E883